MWEFFRPVLVDFQNPVIYAIPFFLLLVFIEVYLNYKQRTENYVLKDSLASISMGLGSIVSDILAKSTAYIGFFWLYTNVGLFSDTFAEHWILAWVLLFFLDDFTFYWHHRLSHQVRVLWAAHVNHHSSEEYNLSTALRQSWTEIFYKYLFFMWLAALGFHPLMILTQMSINLIYQFWIHTKAIKRFPKPIELLMNTPSHHRVHHGSNVIYLDRNHAGTLIIWDRMFGTFQEELENEPVIYGITTNITTYNPFKIAGHEFGSLWRDVKKAPTFKAKMGYILQPPGWSHDGSTQTANEMRAALKQSK